MFSVKEIQGCEALVSKLISSRPWRCESESEKERARAKERASGQVPHRSGIKMHRRCQFSAPKAMKVQKSKISKTLTSKSSYAAETP